jgi:hypothetical protein
MPSASLVRWQTDRMPSLAELDRQCAASLTLAAPNPRLAEEHLAALNKWRNVAAHHSTTLPPGIPLTLASVQTWRVACDELTAALDAILYNQLRRILRRKPW